MSHKYDKHIVAWFAKTVAPAALKGETSSWEVILPDGKKIRVSIDSGEAPVK